MKKIISRRDFIKSSAAGVAALAASGTLGTIVCAEESTEALSETVLDETAEISAETAEALVMLDGEQKGATEYTSEANRAHYDLMDFEDQTEYECATKGLIDAPETLELTDEDGNVVWSQDAYDFLDYEEEAPDSVHPGLWRNAALNHFYGLYEVMEGIYQVRGYDMANLTVVATDSGWLVIDTTMSSEAAAAAMQLIEKNLGERPVKALVISHTHVDHYGGMTGVISEEEVADASLSLEEQLASGKAPVIVPEGFMEEVVSENVYAGTAMSRRAAYQYGTFLTPGAQGPVSVGIGTGQSVGSITFIAPTHEITYTGETITVDGLEIQFQLTPGTEAPAEMNMYFPQMRALWIAENATGTMHNLYTIRGAQVRDGNAWAKYLNETKALYGEQTDVIFQSHNWPHFGQEAISEYLTNTAAVYKYINDRTLMYINDGYTADEIAEMIELPEALSKVWYTRQYYGTLSHNSKAVYQRYMGWYDANPAHLDPLPPEESAKKWVKYLGDTDRVLALAMEDYENGEYRWVAEVTNVLVYADPENQMARYLCADAMEQLGYQAESGAWRNAYLSGAWELRHGYSAPEKEATRSQMLRQSLTGELLLDYLGIMTSTELSADADFRVNLYLQDVGEQYLLHFYHGALLYYKDQSDDAAVASLTCNKVAIYALISKNLETAAQAIQVDGDETILETIIGLVAENNGSFNIIEP
ncbi:MAG: MBL fold metallo-hydrolase [Clostridiales bacterium]|nr:MBL fold metallo-hydrolase [Clostridiales bacterium]